MIVVVVVVVAAAAVVAAVVAVKRMSVAFAEPAPWRAIRYSSPATAEELMDSCTRTA